MADETNQTKKLTAKQIAAAIKAGTYNTEQPLSPRVIKQLEQMEAFEAARKHEFDSRLKTLIATSRELGAARKTFRQAQRHALYECYKLYLDISNSDNEDWFYDNLREHMHNAGYKIQKNTPNAGLLIRIVWGNEAISNQTIFRKVKVLEYARHEQIEPEHFIDYITQKGKMAQIQASTSLITAEEREERKRKARLLILQYMEYRDEKPLFSIPTTAHYANAHVNPKTGLCVLIGTARRRFDRSSDYADFNITHVMPPQLDLEIKLIDRWAKFIEPVLELYEENLQQLPQQQWCELIEEKLWENDVAEAEKQSVNWMLRQQAALAEDQLEFNKQATKFKQQRKKRNN